jgi:hypothetical protein
MPKQTRFNVGCVRWVCGCRARMILPRHRALMFLPAISGPDSPWQAVHDVFGSALTSCRSYHAEAMDEKSRECQEGREKEDRDERERWTVASKLDIATVETERTDESHPPGVSG